MSEVYVVKTDGLAAGKGVFVTASWDEAIATVKAAIAQGGKVTIEKDEFAQALGGTVGGSVSDHTWRCVCGEGGTDASDLHAAFSLYAHRRDRHQNET